MNKKSNSKKAASVKSSDVEENAWEAFFVLAKHWQSDLKFFADELQFLKRLMGKYMIWLTDEKNIADAKITGSKLMNLEKRRASIEERVADHLKYFTNLVTNQLPHNAQVDKDRHGELEIALSDFLKEFRSIKKEVFALTERVVDSEKDQHFLEN